MTITLKFYKSHDDNLKKKKTRIRSNLNDVKCVQRELF